MFQDRFHWGFGIEDTFIGDPHPVTGKVLDEYELTDHYRLWKEDFDRIPFDGESHGTASSRRKTSGTGRLPIR